MLEKLGWCALLLAGLAALAWWGPEGGPVCDESRPVFGGEACCRGHKVAGIAASAAERRLGAALPARAPRRGARRTQKPMIA